MDKSSTDNTNSKRGPAQMTFQPEARHLYGNVAPQGQPGDQREIGLRVSESPRRLKRRYQHLRELIDWDADDGEVLPEDSAQEEFLLDTRSTAMFDALAVARRAATNDVLVLIMGERFTGKSVLARQMHLWSPRSSEPFVSSRPGLSGTALESELFGHLRGAFAGAYCSEPGCFEAANGGTVFLGEVVSLPIAMQSRLVDFIRHHRVIRRGSDTPVKLDVRIICSSSHDLETLRRSGPLIPTLLEEKQLITLRMPTLRERREDIIPAAHRILAWLATRERRRPQRISYLAARALLRCSWPGNFRQLRNVIQRASILSRGELIKPDVLPATIATPRRAGNGI